MFLSLSLSVRASACSKKKRRMLYGKWTECLYGVEPKVYEANKKSEKKSDAKKHKQVEVM